VSICISLSFNCDHEKEKYHIDITGKGDIGSGGSCHGEQPGPGKGGKLYQLPFLSKPARM
jgi:hypothetical protein